LVRQTGEQEFSALEISRIVLLTDSFAKFTNSELET